MANQQQPRPLFRFASMFRPTAPAPAPAPQPTRPPAPVTATAPQQPVRPPLAAASFRPPAATTTVRPTQPQESTPPPPSPPQPAVATSSPVKPSPPSPQPPPTRSPLQRSSVPASPTRSPVPAPSLPLRAPSPPSPQPPQPKPAVTLSPPSPTPRSSPTIRSPIMASAQRSPASVSPPPPMSPPPPPAASPRIPSPAYSPAVKQSPPPPASFPTGPRSPPTRISSSVPTSPVQKLPDPITQFTSYSPKPKVQSPPQPFQNYNPPPKPASPVRAPPPSPKTIEPFMKTAQITPMSPLKLPKPAQTLSDSESEPKIPIDQKTVVVQETTERTRGYIPPIRHHESKQNEADEYGMSVLTLAGENRGAIMDLSPARKKYGFNGTPQKLQTEQSDAEKSGSGSDNETRPKNQNGMKRRSLPMTAFMNSNVQTINNSILHNTTCNHHDPGIHLIFSGREGAKPHYLKGSPKTR